MNKQDVKQIAALAKIAVSESECENLQKQFEKILDHFKTLNSLNTDNIEPLFHFHEKMPLRDDTSEEPLNTDELLSNAPSSAGNSFKIPKAFGDSNS